MKRLLPVIIVLCLLGAVFTCLPKSSVQETAFQSLDELNGCKIGIQGGTDYDIYVQEKCPDAEILFFNEFSSIYPSLQQGKIDAMVTENISYGVEKSEIPSLKRVEEPLASLDFSIGVCKNSLGQTALRQLNDFIAAKKADGTMAEWESKWFIDYDRENATADKSGISGENGILVFSAEASFEPACFAGKGGELQGFDVDFIYSFCRQYGYEPKIEPLEYDAMTAALASGKCTIGVGMIPSDERAESISFTEPMIGFDIIVAYDSGEQTNTNMLNNLKNSFLKTFVRDARWKMFLQGVGTTLLIATLSVVFGSILGLLLYQWCAHGKRGEKRFTNLLCWIMSSTPTVVLLMILYYVVFGKYIINNIAVAVTGFTLIFGCGFYELILSGIKAVGKGQEEAAYAQGFSMDQAFFHIILPQAAEHFLPGYQGSVISLIQETSVVGYIAIMDLTKMSDLVRGRTFEAFFPLLATACIYFLIIWLLTTIIKKISALMNTKNRKTEKILKGIER